MNHLSFCLSSLRGRQPPAAPRGARVKGAHERSECAARRQPRVPLTRASTAREWGSEEEKFLNLFLNLFLVLFLVLNLVLVLILFLFLNLVLVLVLVPTPFLFPRTCVPIARMRGCAPPLAGAPSSSVEHRARDRVSCPPVTRSRGGSPMSANCGPGAFARWEDPR